MRIFRPWFVAAWLYRDAIFRLKTGKKLLCLTFDDGPDPQSTPQILDILAEYHIKAIFFCSGRASENYPDIMNRIILEGHLIGNHGYSHLNGWRTSLGRYVADVDRASNITSPSLFRPPYGRLRLNQYYKLKERYKIVFWDIMPYDFDSKFGSQNSLWILKKKIRPGSIIVLHDNRNGISPEILEDFILFSLNAGYQFDNTLSI